MRKLFFIIVFIQLTINCYSQSKKDSLNPIVRKFRILPSPFGYIWQGSNNFDIGLQPMILLNAKNYHNNIGIVIAGNLVFINKATYFTPSTKLKLYHELKNRKMAWEASIGYSYTNIQSKYDRKIIPEFGIEYRWFHLTYGYNIPLTNYTDSYTNSNRIALLYFGW